MRREWKRLKQSAKSGEPGLIIHANTGNRNRVSFAPYKEAREGLQGFIENLVGHHTEERATRLVRESLTTIERGDSHVVHLASSNTKRKLYEHYCYQRGWVPGRTADGSHEEEEPEYFCHTCGKYSHYMCSSVINGVCTCNQCALGI